MADEGDQETAVCGRVARIERRVGPAAFEEGVERVAVLAHEARGVRGFPLVHPAQRPTQHRRDGVEPTR